MRRLRSPTATLMIGLLLALSACSNAKVEELRSEVQTLRGINGELNDRVKQLESAVALLTLSQTDTSIRTLRTSVGNLEDDIYVLEQWVSDIDSRATDNEAEIEYLRGCVNDYMDTIASWSSNVSFSFTYFYC